KLWSASAEIETKDYAMSLVRNRSSSPQVRLVQRERIGRRGTAGQSQERSSRNRSITSWAARGILLAVKYGRLSAPSVRAGCKIRSESNLPWPDGSALRIS